MKITSPKLQTSHLAANEEALLRCQTALELKDKGDYEGAQEVMRRFWKRVGERPEIKGLRPAVAGEVLLCAGILTGWIGSKSQIEKAQEIAKDLITESVSYFESEEDQTKLAIAQTEIAYCYWRDGELDEARILLCEALKTLTKTGTARARAILKLTTVEFSAARYHEALRLLTDNAALFQESDNYTTRGAYHGQIAIALRNIAKSEKRAEYIQRAIAEFRKADQNFKLARNPVFRADVKNNVALILSNLSRFKEAHEFLNEARRLSVSFRDKSRTAQIDESRAQVFLAHGKPAQAEAVARRAVSALEKTGHQLLIAEASITWGISLARLGMNERAQVILQRAYEIASNVGALDKAGLAALTLIEEVDKLTPATLQAAYDRALAWLSTSEEQEILSRLNKAAGKLASSLRGELTAEQATKVLLTKADDLQQKMLEYERKIIKQALAQTDGRVTHAASLLGLSYQGLAYMIEARHPGLLKERSPVHRRSRRRQHHK